MVGHLARFLRRVGLRVEELILLLIILLNVLDFFEILPGDIDYIKKIISWTALGYLLYRASMTKLFFGKRHHKMDLALILTYFTLIVKNLVAVSAATIDETSVHLSFFYRLIIQNAQIIEEFSFYLGGTMLFVLAMYAAFRYDIFTPSLMHVIHEEGPHPKTVGKFIVRFGIVLMVLVFFFIAVFNLMMEWLAIAVDAPLVMLGLFFYLFKAKNFGTETLIYKLGNMGESFYERFIELFHVKERIFLGVSGMLVLHLLTDIGNFVLPHLVGIHDHIYFSQFGPGHTPIPQLFMQDFGLMATLGQKLALVGVYSLNVIGIIMLLIAPAFLWYALFRDKPIKVAKGVLGFFAAAVSAFLLGPVFHIGSIASPALVGVDITTQAASSNSFPIMSVALLSLTIGFLVYLLSHQRFLKQLYVFAGVLISVAFFAMYIYFFFMDVTQYYLGAIPMLYADGKMFVGTLLMLFFLTTVIFYIGGLLMFFYELVKN